MKILFLAHRIPYPPNKGDKIRSFNEVRALAERGHEVHLRAFVDDVDDLGFQSDLLRWCASVEVVPLRRFRAMARAALNLFNGRSFSIGYYASRKMRRSVKRAMAEHRFDAAVAYSSTMAQYVPPELATRTVVDLVDIDSEKWRIYAGRMRPPRSWQCAMEWKRLRRYEYEIISRFAYTVLTTEREAALLDKLDEFTRRARVKTITNGVDLSEFLPDRQIAGTPRLVFVGVMDYFANVEGVRWFVEEVFPLIRGAEPQAEFVIIGSRPTEEVLHLGRRDGVKVTGFVKEVEPYLLGATVCVVPLRIARGVQNKVLEAMAAGCAIVATHEAAAGLRVTSGEHLLLASAPRRFADAVIELIRDWRLREALGDRARYYVETEHDWAPLLQKFAGLVETAGARARGSEGTGFRAIAGN